MANTLATFANTQWTYSHTVKSLKVRDITHTANTYPNTVIQTYWEYSANTPEGVTGTFNGATPFTIDPTSNNFSFIDFEHLEEEDVWNWIYNVITDGYAQHIQEKIGEQIHSKINIITEPSLPWASGNTSNTAG